MIIYQATNNLNGKVYIGKTTQRLTRRISGHKKDAKRGGRTIFIRAIRKHGFDSFRFEPLAWCDSKEHLNFFEKFYISLKNSKAPNGYNLTDGGDGGLGHHHTEETKTILREKRKLQVCSDDTRKKISEAKIGNQYLLGYEHSEGSKQKMSESHKGLDNHQKGKKYPYRPHLGQTEKMRGRKISGEHKEKISRGNRGHIHSKEARQKMSDNRKGKCLGNKNALKKLQGGYK